MDLKKHHISNLTEEEQLELFYKSRDNKWLGLILERYTVMLFGVGMKYLNDEDAAKDLVQQVMLKALDELHKYRVLQVGGWLYRIAVNLCMTHFRAKKSFTSDDQLEHVAHIEPESAEELIDKERFLDEMTALIPTLKYEQQICIESFYLKKISYRKIAEQLSVDVKEVKSHIQNGKRNLRLKLEALYTSGK